MSDYNKWLMNEELDTNLKKELKKMSRKEREDAFYKNLSFGTGGMRGILGAGTNRMNIYTIRKANFGFGKYLLKKFKDECHRGVVISYDNRHMSREFAFESAKVLGALGIKTYVFNELRPTPELSFAVRNLNAISGIMVTASHNPSNYNGYKIYDEYGCQYTPEFVEDIIAEIEKVDDLFSIPTIEVADLEKISLIEYVGTEMDDKYLAEVKTVALHSDEEKNLKIVFTPLHGTSAEVGTRLLKEEGYFYLPVSEQLVHDPNFSTVKSPNPENKSAFEYAEKIGKQNDADILIATDPDADRIGIAIKNGKDYVYLTGNQTGAIMIYYLLNEKKNLGILPQKGKVFNTIVTSDLGAKIARSFGFEVFSTLTGFKYIGEQARYLEGTDYEFIFGYEESYGYVIKDFVRDKDSLQALLLICDAANYYKNHFNKNFVDVLNDIYNEYGVYREALKNIELEGKEGAQKIDNIMNTFRNMDLKEIAGLKVFVKEDYESLKRYSLNNDLVTDITLPTSNVLKFILSNGSWFVLRPSGTEPKIKIYVGVTEESIETADALITSILTGIMSIVKEVE